jgi:flagellar biosynthesis GTPase FlhF
MIVGKVTKEQLLNVYKTKNICLEGNILKLIDPEDDTEFAEYLKICADRDKESRRKRLEITKRIQTQNTELTEAQEQNEKLMQELQASLADMETSKAQIECQNKELLEWKEENEKMDIDLREALRVAENAKLVAENDLDLMQKKTQFELINNIVRVALYIILGVGVATTGMFVFAMVMNYDTTIISSAWSNMFGILLTNSFSIVGTIMGVKYASEKSNS